MSKTIPSIQKYMTTSPHSIGQDQTLAKAESMMQELGIRHLPVMSDGKLCGIVTDRDVKFLKNFKDIDPKETVLTHVANPEVFTVSPHSMMDDVCDQMAEHKYGCAVVMDNHQLVGIFTWVDALRAMSELLHTRLSK